MKYEWKKADKELYLPKNKPVLVTVPAFNFFMMEGKGDPSSESFSEQVGLLYSLAYSVKMMPKKGITPEGYYEFSVFPLEGIWDLVEEAKVKETLDKDDFKYTIMIRQPDFVTERLAQDVLAGVKEKKPHPFLDRVRFGQLEEGLCLQMLHIGPYDEEFKSFSLMEDYCRKHNFRRKTKIHREIYLSDPRRTQPDKLKTVLRFKVENSLSSD
ncbi:hypothetical protein Desor_3559 [Desulfosporosinus orientis DSM 765]|uniref:GyrI-like small molecule binding domain-containing protein n=1 Tax=Desulfosporosinus orientis (strain ATCC 19365 / DSM 765 / NCIMB 8382 / VKM B-1628 / Singapore I) TaxID=768706 RepID=G7WIG7_DESOD|nr:GyrI-like domain-containing protein [Desulfosporosinus orientis]AET69041.1 hypothetical protein Desor_3559 [Desulfosporosinus orientis DSM 765]